MTAYQAKAQDIPFEKGKKYILGGLTVTGAESYNEQTVKAYTGLHLGQEITVPGAQISDVINKLIKLQLFSDVSFYITDVKGKEVFLELYIQERPAIREVTVYGVKKRKVKDVLKETELTKGRKITESFIANTRNYLTNKYKKKGYLNTKVNIATKRVENDSTNLNSVDMVVNIVKGSKVKIRDINIEGNEKLADGKVRGAMKNTKRKFFGRFWKKSKFIKDDYDEDLKSIVDAYAENGYRDARVVADTIVDVDDNSIDINLNVVEGRRYFFGDIKFVGNTVYSDRDLARALGIKKGDVYNGVKLKKKIQDQSKPDALDLTNMYQNNGYMFSQLNPVEVSAKNDTVAFEVRIIEGKETFFNHVSVAGNDRTNDYVIYRMLRTKPGERYSKQEIIRTIRELGGLGYFNAETINPQILNPNPNEGTLDLEYGLEEKGSSQIELQGGYGGGGFIGTLGLSFNNFSIKNILNGKAYQPVPMGDGQSFSLRVQASRTFRTYSASFSEPWLGGKKPINFSFSVSRTQQFLFDFANNKVDKSKQFAITGVSLGLGKRLEWPDDNFLLSHALSYQNYDLQDYNVGLFTFGNGTSNNLAYTLALSRKNVGVNPIFPTYGSEFTLSAKVSLPYSAFNDVDYTALKEERESLEQAIVDNPGTSKVNSEKIANIDQERFRWLEFYKIKFTGTWYNNVIFKKMVLRSNVEFGFLGAYDNDRGVIPFERFFVGGDGLGNFTLDGRENIQLRGYENQSITPLFTNPVSGRQSRVGGTIYNKFSLELRYPLTLKPTASIYGLAFLEGGNAFNNFQEFNPFNLKRSAGLGLRIFMPAFGLLGIDFGYGFDEQPGSNTGSPHGWETHFIIGQRF